MRLKVALLFAITLALASALAAGNHAQTKTVQQPTAQKTADDTRYPCREVHTFDFWVGDFDATPWDQPNSPPRGQLHNTREYEGCVIVERWSSPRNAGMSMSFYDASRKQWRMIWNDDSNGSNDFDEGSYTDGAMRFKGWVRDSSGKKLLASNVLQNVSPGVIRHIYSVSTDNGKTWEVKSDGRFTRREAPAQKQ